MDGRRDGRRGKQGDERDEAPVAPTTGDGQRPAGEQPHTSPRGAAPMSRRAPSDPQSVGRSDTVGGRAPLRPLPPAHGAPDATASDLIALNRREPPRTPKVAPGRVPGAGNHAPLGGHPPADVAHDARDGERVPEGPYAASHRDELAGLDRERILELPVRLTEKRVHQTPPLADALIEGRPTTHDTPESGSVSEMEDGVPGGGRVTRLPVANRLRRASAGLVRPTGNGAPSRPMLSLREAAAPYLARLAGRRSPEAPETPASPDAERERAEQAPRKSSRTPRQPVPPDPNLCPLCHGVGYVRLDVPVGNPAFGKAVLCECKEREIEQRERQKLRDLSSLKPFDKKTFDTFDLTLPGVREAYDVALRYAEDPNGWLILQGGYGCGKTHLAAAIAQRREHAGDTVFFSIVPDLLDHLRAAFAPTSDITYDALFDRVRHAGLLVLDDLGSENSTAWATEKLFQIINYRYNSRMPTVITTNVRLLSHTDERIRSRLSDRGLVRWVTIESPDYRERHVGPGGRPPRGGGSGAPRGRGTPR